MNSKRGTLVQIKREKEKLVQISILNLVRISFFVVVVTKIFQKILLFIPFKRISVLCLLYKENVLKNPLQMYSKE